METYKIDKEMFNLLKKGNAFITLDSMESYQELERFITSKRYFVKSKRGFEDLTIIGIPVIWRVGGLKILDDTIVNKKMS